MMNLIKEKGKKLMALLTVCALMVGVLPIGVYAADQTGIKWGTDITESINGNTLTLSGTGTMTDFGWTNNDFLTSTYGITEVIIEDGITSIGTYAFRSNQLTSITIPNSVISIGDVSFDHNKLTSITIPNSVTNIGNCAFSNNELTSITIPNNVMTIGKGAFSDNVLTSITLPNSITSISQSLFSNNKLESIIIPNNIINIGIGAFFKNELTSISIPNSVTTIEDNAFNYNQLTSLTIPESVTTIKASAFRNNQLTSLTIPNSVTLIGDYVFANNILTSVEISNALTEIPYMAFGDNRLTTIEIPNSVITIGDSAFMINLLTSITIPNSVKVIGNNVFQNNKLTSITIPSNVEAIGDNVFQNNNLTSITMDRADTTIGNRLLYFMNDRFKIAYMEGGIGEYTGTQMGDWSKGLSDAKKLALDTISVQTAIDNLAVTNSTTQTDIINTAIAASIYADDVAFLEYEEIKATSSAVGTLSGIIRLMLGSEISTITFNKTIAQLPPVVVNTTLSLAEGAPSIGVVSGEGDSLTYTLQTGPQYGAVTFNGDGSFTYLAHRQPTVGFVNSDTFTFSARDSGNRESNIATVSIAITPVNDAPVATPKSITTNIGVETNGNVSATDVDGDELNYGLVTSAQHGTLTFNSDGSYRYTATDNTQTSDSFVFKANDGLVDSTNATVTITLVGAIDNIAPVLTSGAVTRTSHTEGTVKFTSDEAGTYYYEVVADGATVPTINTTGAGIVCTTAETTITNPTGLTAGAKDIYIVVKDGAGNVSDILKIDIPNYTAPNSGGSSSNEPVIPQTPKDEPVIIVVNGEEQDAGKETKTSENGKSVVTITVDNKTVEDKVDDAIKNNKTGATNSIQVPVKDITSDVAKVELTGDIIKKLENNSFNISIKRDTIEYVIPAEEFAISSVAKNLDVLESNLVDIKLEVQIATLDEAVVKKFNDVVKANSSELVFPPVSFKVVAKTTKADGTTDEVVISKFNNYVQRVMEIPEGVDPKTITTGVVFNQDGTYSHVPTTVYQKDGKWFASLNSLTNSNYSVIWNQVTVESVENHWSKEVVNDMASRLIIFNPEKFKPNKAITRADFAEYIVRALGVYREDSIYENKFKDVTSTGDRTLAILIASEYGIVSGYADGTFKPDALITREEAMVMYQRAMKVTKLTGEDSNRYQNYKDFEAVSPWAVTSVKEVLAAHVFNGTAATTISPKSNLTYAEAAQAIKSLLVESKLIND